jgi:hypothetical protein
MNWKLTPQERRIIAHTQREGEQAHTPPDGTETPTATDVPLWRSILAWIGGFALLILIALLMVWVGSLID